MNRTEIWRRKIKVKVQVKRDLDKKTMGLRCEKQWEAKQRTD